ncbi:reverse transcriptase-like protein [Plakobranchus ocellatus]|uniref:Reverse transcriptase-like protein n=1 Tax=Plakobranchus ocellatus TaxID=259542 RepID=A0AAV3ZLJ4_9GAST|nr:reverse transcriptase-like protein [Plakobranchus ocellatus]
MQFDSLLHLHYFNSFVTAYIQGKVSQLSAYLDNVYWLLKLILEDCVYLVQSIICITHWRGFWILLDEYDPYRPESLWVCHVASYLLLTASMAAQNLVVKGVSKDGALPHGEGIQLNVSYVSGLSQWCALKLQVDLNLAYHK